MEITINDETHEVAEGITIAQLLEELKLTGRPVGVEVNLTLVPASHHTRHVLAAGDCLEIVTLVGGG